MATNNGRPLALRSEADRLVVSLKAEAKRLADAAGLFEEAALQATLPDDSWLRHWPLLVHLCGFHRIDGFLGSRSTKKARVKAAILGRENVDATCDKWTDYLSGRMIRPVSEALPIDDESEDP